MEAEKTLTERITALTMDINKNHPELSKYISEMTVTIPDEKKPHVESEELKEYYDSLIAMVKKYKPDYTTHK